MRYVLGHGQGRIEESVMKFNSYQHHDIEKEQRHQPIKDVPNSLENYGDSRHTCVLEGTVVRDSVHSSLVLTPCSDDLGKGWGFKGENSGNGGNGGK